MYGGQSSAGLTRQEFLARGAGIGVGIAGLSGLLAASAEGALSGGSAGGGQITYYSWQGPEPRWKEIKDWRASKNISLKASFANSNSDIVTKFTTGGGKGIYNLSFIEVAWMRYLKDRGILQPIDLSKLPNYARSKKFLYPVFTRGSIYKKYFNFDGQQWGLPVDWGYAATNYDSSKVPPPKTLMDLTKPPYRGKFVVTSDNQGMIFQAAFSLGFKDLNGYYTRDQFKQIVARLQEVFAAARRVNVSFGDLGNLYQNGEVVASLTTWPGFAAFVPGKKSKDIKSVLFKEGALGYVDAYFIPADAPDVDVVYAFLNEFLTPRQQAGYGNTVNSVVADRRSWALLSPAVHKYWPSDPGPILSKAPVVGLPIDPPSGIVPVTEWLTAWEHLTK